MDTFEDRINRSIVFTKMMAELANKQKDRKTIEIDARCLEILCEILTEVRDKYLT